jgi:hypothetical protein
MKRPYLTLETSHAMASAEDGTMPGVSLDDYARHALERHDVFSNSIVTDAVRHLANAGRPPERPETMSKGRWTEMLWEIDP